MSFIFSIPSLALNLSFSLMISYLIPSPPPSTDEEVNQFSLLLSNISKGRVPPFSGLNQLSEMEDLPSLIQFTLCHHCEGPIVPFWSTKDKGKVPPFCFLNQFFESYQVNRYTHPPQNLSSHWVTPKGFFLSSEMISLHSSSKLSCHLLQMFRFLRVVNSISFY